MSSYCLYNLREIKSKIKKLQKELATTLRILDSANIPIEVIYKKGIVKDTVSNIKELKQRRKKLFKERVSLNAKLLGTNTRYYGDDGSSGVHYWAFHKGCTNDDIIVYLEMLGIDTEGVHWNSMYDCTGKYFSHEVDIYEKEKTIVASQSWGYDV